MQKLAILYVILVLATICPGHTQTSWTEISQPGVNLNITDQYNSYTFYNEKVGSHGSKYVLNKSTDGSHTFSMIKTKTGDFGCYSMEELFFLDAETGFFSEVCQGIASIYMTTDGGSTWIETGMGGSYGISMFFLRQDYAYYSFYPGSPNDSYLMRNGSQAFVTKKYVFAHNNYQYPGQKTEIIFQNDSTGFIMCMDSLNNAVIIKSTDYGISWTEKHSMKGETFNDMIFISVDSGFVVGSNGTLLATWDEGENWSPLNTTNDEDFNSIDFAEDGTGYIAGNSGTILMSASHGETWSSVSFTNNNDLVYVRLFNDEIAFVLDANGKLYCNQGGANVEEHWDDGINIYPNPAIDVLNINFTNEYLVFEVSIYDLQGRKLISSKQRNIDINSCNKGTYIIEIQTEKGCYRERFVKQ